MKRVQAPLQRPVGAAVDPPAEPFAAAAAPGTSVRPELPDRPELVEDPEGVDGAAEAGEGDELQQRLVEAVDTLSPVQRRPELPAQDPRSAADGGGRDAGEA